MKNLFKIKLNIFRIGRKKPLMIAIALQSITGVISAYAVWYELFLLFKFISAIATGGTMLVSFVLRKFLISVRNINYMLYRINFNCK